MDLHIRAICNFLIISSLICFQTKAEATGSVLFIDSPTHRYLRVPSSNHDIESHSILLSEVGAAVSVLLGFAPPPTLSAAGSSKLNEILMPNPFDRPRAVFTLEVTGLNDAELLVDQGNSLLSNGLRKKIILGSNRSNIQLPDGDEVSVISLDEPVADFTDKEISDFGSWLGGSYVTDAAEPLHKVLTIPLANGNNFNFHVSKDVDRKFVASLLSLVRNFERAMEMHEDMSQTIEGPAELLMGSFDGIKNLQAEYGTEGVQKGQELLIAALSKTFDSLQAAYKGQIVGVIFCNRTPEESGKMLNVMLTSRPSPRWLAEEKESPKSADEEVELVRRTLAWLTGIILLISTLLGIYFLLNMPLTRDTLLYSNVKLD